MKITKKYLRELIKEEARKVFEQEGRQVTSRSRVQHTDGSVSRAKTTGTAKPASKQDKFAPTPTSNRALILKLIENVNKIAAAVVKFKQGAPK